MSSLQDFYTLVTDSAISSDAWGDYFLDEAIALVDQIKNTKGLQECLDLLDKLPEDSQFRLLQAVTSIETKEIFPSLIKIIEGTTPEIAEVIVDNLRNWELSDQERQQLIQITQPFKGKWSVLLDRILDNEIDTLKNRYESGLETTSQIREWQKDLPTLSKDVQQ